jgi:hypothetical protein
MALQQEAELEIAKIVVGRDASDLKKFGTKGTLYLGKHLVGAGEEAHTTTPLLVDALRPHMIVLCGKRGEGKCLAPYSEVLMPDGTTKSIDELFKLAAGDRSDWTKSEELFPCIEPITILSLDTNSLDLKPMTISHVYRKKVNEKLLKVVTKRGKEVLCTKEHPLLVVEEALTWRSAEELHNLHNLTSAAGANNSSGNVMESAIMKAPPKSALSNEDELSLGLQTAKPASEETLDSGEGFPLANGKIQIGSVQATNRSSGGQLLKSYILSWDDIDKIEEVAYEGYVYDLTVLGTHNFVANGIVCHNSYSMGVLAEELKNITPEIGKNLCALMIDTQGIFWTMKSPNEKDLALLAEWQLKPKGFETFVYVPEGQEEIFKKAGVVFDGTFGFGAHELAADDWLSVFELDPNQPLGILLQRSINRLKEEGIAYSIDDIVAAIKSNPGFEAEKLALENRFEAAKGWGIFGASRMPSILEPNRLAIIDVSLTPQNVRSLLVALASRRLFAERTVARRREELAEAEGIPIKRTPMPWLMIDEAHNFIPDEGRPTSLETLLKITREGRQPGITLVLVTQRPEKLHPDALAQTDLLISHRLTSKGDIDALRRIMQTYLLFPIEKYMNELPKLKGAALILDDNSERIYSARIRPRQSWHAGASPVAL